MNSSKREFRIYWGRNTVLLYPDNGAEVIMARYRKIDVRMWNDAKVAKLSDEGKLIFFFLLTAPQTTMIGAIPIDKYTVCRYLNMDAKRYDIGYQQLKNMGMVEYDERGLFFIRNFLKYNPPDNPKVVSGWSSFLDVFPECELLETIAKSVITACLARGDKYIDALGKEYKELAGYGIGNGMAFQRTENREQELINVATQHMSAEEKTPSADLPPEPSQEETLTLNSDASAELTPAQRAVRVGKHCPQQKIIDLYHEVLPALPRVRIWNTAKRKQMMAARWREMASDQEFQSEAEGLDFFRRFFEFVSHSPFLMGQSKNADGRSWCADLEWLLKAENFTKVCERKYHRD